jgi:broad specificity phosphatase PhoE
LDDALRSASIGEVTGGATMQGESGEIEYCDIEIQVTDPSPDSVNKIIETLERLGAPKGSKLKIEAENRELLFGICEGLAVRLNGSDLPAEVYKRCDSHFVYAEFERLLEGEGRVLSYWEGQTKTMFYLYGKSAVNMKKRISPFINSHPLYQKCRVEQIV